MPLRAGACLSHGTKRHGTAMESGTLTYNERFEIVVTRHEGLIVRMCLRRALGDTAMRRELHQECLIGIWRHLDTLRPGATLRQERLWVYWQCRAAFTDFRPCRLALDVVPIGAVEDWHLAVPVENAARERVEVLAELLEGREREAFMMMAEGCNADEIAEELGIKPRSAVQLRYRITAKLRKIYKTK